MSPDDYCQDKARSSGSSFYYSFFFLSEQQRRAITALYAFCREVDDVVDEYREPQVARTTLDWWRSEIARLFHDTPQHPVTRALKPLLEHYNLAEEYFLEIIDGMQMDLDQTHYADFSELSLYCYRVASVVGLLAAEIFGYQDRLTQKYAIDLGLAFQLTNILRDVREDAQRGRFYIPDDEMGQFGVTHDDIIQGNMHDGVRQLLAMQAERAASYYERAFARLPEVDRFSQRSGVIMSAIYSRILERIIDLDYPVLQYRVTLSPWKKLWLAWRCYRNEKKRSRDYQRKLKTV